MAGFPWSIHVRPTLLIRSIVLAATFLFPAYALACTVVRMPPEPVLPSTGATGVPLNARLYFSANAPGDLHSEYVLVRVDGDGGTELIPTSLEKLPSTAGLDFPVRLTPDAPLQPNATYGVCYWNDGLPDGGAADLCPPQARTSTFTTGSATQSAAPPSASGVRFEVADHELPDAGIFLFCSGERRARTITATVPDAGADVLYFGRVGDAGIFSALTGPKLAWGMHYPAVTASGVLVCDNKPHETFAPIWGLPTGTTTVEVWTEDVAGNASPPVAVSLEGDCSTQPASSDGGTEPEPPASGCSSTPGAAWLGLGALALAALAIRRRTRASR